MGVDGYRGREKALQLVLGEPRLEVSTASVEQVGASAGLLMDRVIAATVAPAAHRKRVLPARHVCLQLGRRLLEFCPEPLWQIGLHAGTEFKQWVATARVMC
jgi:hypothetical protein